MSLGTSLIPGDITITPNLMDGKARQIPSYNISGEFITRYFVRTCCKYTDYAALVRCSMHQANLTNPELWYYDEDTDDEDDVHNQVQEIPLVDQVCLI